MQSELVVRVFHQKLRALISTLKSMFPSAGPPQYLLYTVEFQKRGLPHAHILVKYSLLCIESDFIDAVISAELS